MLITNSASFTLPRLQKAIDERLQTMLSDGQDLPGAITLLLSCRETAARMSEYRCIESLAQKLQDTQLMTEVQLDRLLNDMCTDFDAKKYAQLQEAFRLLDKSAIDQLHINFISQIHSIAFQVVQMEQVTTSAGGENSTIGDGVVKQKPLFEQLCMEMPVIKYIPRLIQLCKSFWKILSCHHQITMWHQNYSTPSAAVTTGTEVDLVAKEEYIREKLRSGQSRVWSDIQNKVCMQEV